MTLWLTIGSTAAKIARTKVLAAAALEEYMVYIRVKLYGRIR